VRGERERGKVKGSEGEKGVGERNERKNRREGGGGKSCILIMCDYLLIFHGRTSVRTLAVYSVHDLSKPQAVVGTNVSPATLLPYYDLDTHLLFLSGKVLALFPVHPHSFLLYLLSLLPSLFPFPHNET